MHTELLPDVRGRDVPALAPKSRIKMTQELSGRVAIVTGAVRNIGRAIALALADGGAAVVVNARSNLREAEAVVGEIERTGGKAIAITADVVDAGAVGKMVDAAAARFGRIDILVNNAAVRAEQPLETMTLADWRAVTGVILDGAFNCVKACLPHLKESDAGAIVNIGGLSAHTGAARRPPGQPLPQHHSLVHALVGRRGQPSDIAAAVRFLCGPDASFITGQNIQVNGGTFLE